MSEILDVNEAYIHLSKQYMQFDTVHFDRFYDEVRSIFTFVNKSTGIIYIVRSKKELNTANINWKLSAPITFIPLDTILSVTYSPDLHFIALQRSVFLVDLYDLTNGNHTSISVKRKTGGILFNGCFFSGLYNPNEDKNGNESQSIQMNDSTSATETKTSSGFLGFGGKKTITVYKGWNFILVTNFEIQSYFVTHIKHIYKLIKSYSVTCTKFRFLYQYNILFTYIENDKEPIIHAYILLYNTIQELSSLATPKPLEGSQIVVMCLYKTIYLLQYIPSTGMAYITDYTDYLETMHVFKAVQLPVTGHVTNLYYDNLIMFISSSQHAACLLDVHQLTCPTPLTPILLQYVTSSSDYEYIYNDIKPATSSSILSHTFDIPTLGLKVEESFTKYIDGDYIGRRYPFFDNSACIRSCSDNIFPENSRLLSIGDTLNMNMNFSACADLLQQSTRPLTITVETNNPPKDSQEAYYPIKPIINSPSQLNEDEISITNIYDTDNEFIYPYYLYNKHTGRLFNIFVDIHQLSSLIAPKYIYAFLSQRKHYDPLFIKTEILSVLYRYIYKQNNYISLVFDQINDIYKGAAYVEPNGTFNPLYFNEEFNGISHIPLQDVRDSKGYVILNQCDIISYVFDPSLYSEDQYKVLSIYITDYYKSLVDHEIQLHPFLVELLIYLYVVLSIYPQLVNLLLYTDCTNIPDSTRLLLNLDKNKVPGDIYNSLVNIALDNLKKNGKWRDICMFYIKNYKISNAITIIINHPTNFESGRQIWIHQLFDNSLQLSIDRNDISYMYQLYTLLKVWSPNTLKNYTSEGGNELSHILGDIPDILLTQPYHYICSLFGLNYEKNK